MRIASRANGGHAAGIGRRSVYLMERFAGYHPPEVKRLGAVLAPRCFPMAESKPAKKGPKRSAKGTTGKASKGFTDEERHVRLQRQGEPRRRHHVADRLRAEGVDRRRRGKDRRAREESGELRTERRAWQASNVRCAAPFPLAQHILAQL